MPGGAGAAPVCRAPGRSPYAGSGPPARSRPTTDHYQRLGVAPSASTEEIRTAYRTLAGRLHPDRVMEASPAERALADRRMREVNESWNVLRDAGRRRAYDDSRLRGSSGRRRADGPGGTTAARRAASPSPSSGSPVDEDEDLVDVMPPMSAVSAGLFRHLPWVVLLVVFGLIFVLTAYAGTDDATPDPGPQVEAGSCVDVSPGPVTTIVSCEGAHDLEIVGRVRTASACPAGSEARRLGDDAVIDCVVEGPAGPSVGP